MSSTPTVKDGALRRPTPRRWPYRIKCKLAGELRKREVVTTSAPYSDGFSVRLMALGTMVISVTRRMRVACPGCELDAVVDERDAYSAAVGHARRCPGLARLNRPAMVVCWGCDGVGRESLKPDRCIICDGRGWLPR